MTPESGVPFAARLSAIEYVLERVVLLATAHYSDEMYQQWVQAAGDALDRETFPGTAEQSLLRSGELRDQVLRLLGEVQDLRRQAGR